MEVAQLAKKAIKGDDDAFLALINEHKIQLYKIAFSFLKNQNDALEAVQETTYRAYRSIHNLREPEYFSTWLIRIVINYCNDTLKVRKPLIFNEILQHPDSRSESFLYLEIQDAMEELEEKQREILMLRYFHDLKIKDIAEVYHCPESTVKTWLTKALKALRHKLEKGENFHV